MHESLIRILQDKLIQPSLEEYFNQVLIELVRGSTIWSGIGLEEMAQSSVSSFSAKGAASGTKSNT